MTTPAAAHPGHDAGVALPPAHERRRPRRCCATVAHRDRRRDPRAGPRQARRAPGAVARAARGAGRPAAPAHRPLGDAEAARRGRPLPRRRRPRVRARGRRAPSARSTSAIEVPPSPLSHRLLARAVGRDLRAHRRARSASTARRSSSSTRARWPSASPRSSPKLLGEDAVTSHHGSLSRERRLDAEQRLKAGRAAGAGRHGLARARHRHRRRRPRDPGRRHALDRHVPAARRPRRPRPRPRAQGPALPADARRAGRRRRPCCAACGRAILDRTPAAAAARSTSWPSRSWPPACAEPWDEQDALRRRSAAPGPTATWRARTSTRSSRLHTDGRRALLHRDGVNGRLHGHASARASPRSCPAARSPTPPTTRCAWSPRARSSARSTRTSPIESNGGDIFQLGNTSWRILRVEPGIVRVADAKGAAADAPVLARRGARPHARAVRRDRRAARGVRGGRGAGGVPAREAAAPRCPRAAPSRSPSTSRPGAQALGTVPTQQRVVLERFFDESGGMQLVVHAPFGVAHQPRLGPGAAQALLRRLRLRAAGGGQRGGDRPLARPAAQLPARGGLRLPAPEHRARRAHPGAARRADVRDALALERAALAAARALAQRQDGAAAAPAHARRRPARRGLPAGRWPARRRCRAGPIEVPMEHPIVRQTIEDCLTEAMDVDGFLEVLRGLRDGTHRARARRHRRALGLRARHPDRRSPTRSSTTRRSRSAARRP